MTEDESSIFAITLKDTGETVTVRAHEYKISEGFVRLFRIDEEGIEEFAAYSADIVSHIVQRDPMTPEQEAEFASCLHHRAQPNV